jgi:hypothetical protein
VHVLGHFQPFKLTDPARARRWAAAALAIAVSVLLPIHAHSQSRDSHVKPAKLGTEQSPVVVKILKSKELDEERARQLAEQARAEQARAEQEQRLIDLTGDLARYTKWLFYSTALLTGVTAGLVIVGFFQVRDAKATIEAAKKSADVAERALTGLERPWLFIEKVRIERRDPPPVPNSWFISFVWKNVGRAPAIVEDFVLRIADPATLSEVPNYDGATSLDVRATFPPGEIGETRQIGPSPGPGGQDGTTIEFVVFGRMTYKELNGKVHHTGFAQQVSPHIPASVGYANKAYEFYD